MNAAIKQKITDASPIARAVEIAGGPNALAAATGFSLSAVKRWIGEGVVDTPAAAAAVEDATQITAEELMPAAYWLRADDGELLGVATPLNGADTNYLRQRLGGKRPLKETPLIDDKYEVNSYVAGIMRGLPKDQADDLISKWYAHKDMTDPAALDTLAEDVMDKLSDRSFHLCWGILYEFSDEERDSLLEKHNCMDWLNWNQSRTDALWKDAQELRKSKQPGILKSTKVFSNYDPKPFHLTGLNNSIQLDHAADVDSCMDDLSGLISTAIEIFKESSDSFTQAQWTGLWSLEMAGKYSTMIHSKLFAFDR